LLLLLFEDIDNDDAVVFKEQGQELDFWRDMIKMRRSI
jgi:hypothetical protein